MPSTKSSLLGTAVAAAAVAVVVAVDAAVVNCQPLSTKRERPQQKWQQNEQ